MRSTYSVWTFLALVLVAGCSRSDVAEVAETSDQLSGALASTLPLVTEFEKSGGLAEQNDEPIMPFDENLDFFSPPKMIIPSEPEESGEDASGELPPLRLVGFVGGAGDKAMVAVDGQMHIVSAGKRLNGVEIVSVKSPDVELRWGETDLTLNFYKPSKADRTLPGPTPALTFSSGLSTGGNRSNRQHPVDASTKRPVSAPLPRVQASLPSLPGLPSQDKAAGLDFTDFPDLSAGSAAPPAP